MSVNSENIQDNAQTREEMSQVQQELRVALADLRQEAQSKLKPAEWAEIEKEFADIDETLERLKDGKVWLALVGKTTVGKSSVTNSLLEEDLAEVNVTYDTTKPPSPGTKLTPYEKGPWHIVDLPGIMGHPDYEKYALDEAAKAHGHLFLLEGEPFQDEIEMFDKVHNALPNTPKIVFVNKWDKPMSTRDREAVKARIEQKMCKYVKGNVANIVYGSARPFVPEKDDNVRQPLPQLLERMYEDAGTFGQVVSLIDPANRAHSLSQTVREKVLKIRLALARKVISGFAAASAASPLIPVSELLTTPGILAGLVYALGRVLGQTITRERAKKMAIDLLKACAVNLAIDFVGLSVASTLAQLGLFIPVANIVAVAALGGMACLHYRRTVIFGEVVLEYIVNDFSWGAEGAEAAIKRCKQRALKSYMHLTKEVRVAA